MVAALAELVHGGIEHLLAPLLGAEPHAVFVLVVVVVVGMG